MDSSINLNAQYVDGMTHFGFALHNVRLFDILEYYSHCLKIRKKVLRNRDRGALITNCIQSMCLRQRQSLALALVLLAPRLRCPRCRLPSQGSAKWTL